MNGRRMLCLVLCLGLAGCDDGTSGTDGGGGDRDGGGTNTDGGGMTGNDGGMTGSDGGMTGTDGGGGPTGFTCTDGILFAGHPDYDSDVGNRAMEGDPLSGVINQPMLYRELVFLDRHMVTVTGQEVWSSDLNASSPVVHRLAGREASGQSLADGACADARFANLQDLAVDSSGAIFVMDQTANAVLRITDPFGAGCAVSYWAGTSVDTPDITPSSPPNVGNAEGPGLSAQFALPRRMAIDSNDNLYVWDEGNVSIRKIANDASHTVSTFVDVESTYDGRAQDVIVDAMSALGDELFLYEHDTAGQVILEAFNLATGAHRDLFRNRADGFPDAPYGSIQPGGMTTDGVDLFLYYKGSVYRVSSSSGAMTIIAGDNSVMYTSDFEGGFDPSMSHPALETQLPTRDQFSTAGAGSWLGIDENDDLYFTGSVLDPYIMRLGCGR
ncbi:MAG: hypothetical protein AB7S26_41745 [Sandaracinaceae bacterium]